MLNLDVLIDISLLLGLQLIVLGLICVPTVRPLTGQEVDSNGSDTDGPTVLDVESLQETELPLQDDPDAGR